MTFLNQIAQSQTLLYMLGSNNQFLQDSSELEKYTIQEKLKYLSEFQMETKEGKVNYQM